VAHLLNLRLKQGTLATILVLLFLVPSFLPLVGADGDEESSPSSRNSQLDFTFRNPLQISDSGSAVIDGSLYLEPGTHTITANVSATGSGSGELWLVLQHKGSPILSFSDTTTISMGTVNGNGGTLDIPPVSFSWTATTGAGQELRVKIVSSNEAGNQLGNNIQPIPLAFSVEHKHFGEVLGNTFPAIVPETNQMTIANAINTLNVTATNSGVKALSATMTITLRDNSTTPIVHSFTSNTEILQPGTFTLTPIQESKILSAALDSTTLTGVWNFSATVLYSGTSWSETVTVSETWVKFSDYNAIVLSPSTQIAEPGESTVLTFIVQNTGVVDDLFSISMGESVVPGWTSGVAPSFGSTLPAGSVRLITVPVDVPSNAARSMTNTITLTFTSILSADNYQIDGVGRVMVGDFFNGTAEFLNAEVAKPILPGASANFTVQVNNTGSVASAFSLHTGLSVNALNWTIEVGTNNSDEYSTRVIPFGGSELVAITITAPPIQNPIVTGEYNSADDVIGIWIQCQPIDGGVPSTDNASVKISPIIVVDPGINTEPDLMTSEEVEATITGTIFSRNPALNLRVLHNLPTMLLSQPMDAVITVDKSFTASGDGGFSEAERWDVSVSNPIHNGITPDYSDSTTLNIAGPPAGEYPLAGTFTVSVTVTPTLSAALVGSGVSAVPVTRDYTLIVPSTVKGTFESPTDTSILYNNYDINVGVDNQIPMLFENTGNDVSSYRVRVVNNLPNNWIANFSETDSLIDNLTSDISDGTTDSNLPNGNTTHTQIVNFNIKTDPLAPAGLEQPITIRIEDPFSGELIGDEFVFFVTVGQIYNATLSPTNQSLEMDITESTFTTIEITNTGNAPTDYTISLDTTSAGDVNFEIESPFDSKIFIAAGYQESIRIKMTANASANSDGVYNATVWISANDGQILLPSYVYANISENHSFGITAPEQIAVTPGMQEKVEFEITNSGNLEESVVINFTIEGNITLTDYTMTETIPIDGVYADQVIANIPSLGGTDSLAQGDTFNLTITVIDAESAKIYRVHTVEFIVLPLFIVESNDWPSVMEFGAEGTRTWEVTLTNTGNQDVTVSAVYAITRPGLPNLSADWQMVSESSMIVLPRNTPVVHTFTVKEMSPNPLLSLTADLTLFLTPTNTSIEGSGEFTTQMVMSRFFSTADIPIQPSFGDDYIEVDIPYSHIPESTGAPIAYEVELCDSNRLIDLDAMGLTGSGYSWNISLIEVFADGTEDHHLLDLEQECGTTSIGPTSRYNLLEQSPWNPSSFKLKAEIPSQDSILSGDGWDLTFRLYHPDENAGYTQFTEETFTLALAVYSDPMIKSISSTDGFFEEGEEGIITVIVKNVGTATALDVVVDLQCAGLTLSTSQADQPPLLNRSAANGLNFSMIPFFFPGVEWKLEWVVTAESIDWWEQRSEISCIASLNASYMESNVVDNDQKTLIEDVQSQSPGIQNSFIACITCLLVSIILFRLTAQNENFRLLGIYSGVIGLGFSFHLFQYAWWGFVVLTLSALWIWRVSWGSTEEFRLLHEDYQRARKGVSTLYADHFEELSNTRRQLSVILAVPVLGMLAVVLGIPPTITTNNTNMVSLIAYISVVMIGVWVLIKRADAMYGSLYGRLTDIEVKAIRIERDLGDPARLFNELAVDGLNLDEIFGDAESALTGNSDAIFSNEEVNDDA